MKLDFYSGILRKGHFDQMALLLADNSDEVREVVAHFESERSEILRERWKLFKEWLFTDDAPLIASRVREFVEGLDIVTAPLIGESRPLPPPQPGRLSEPEDDLDDLVETWRDEIDDFDGQDDKDRKTSDPEDDYL
jgi:hypothetical protein